MLMSCGWKGEGLRMDIGGKQYDMIVSHNKKFRMIIGHDLNQNNFIM